MILLLTLDIGAKVCHMKRPACNGLYIFFIQALKCVEIRSLLSRFLSCYFTHNVCAASTVNPWKYKGTSQNEVESCGEHFSQWIEGCRSCGFKHTKLGWRWLAESSAVQMVDIWGLWTWRSSMNCKRLTPMGHSDIWIVWIIYISIFPFINSTQRDPKLSWMSSESAK